ncbi:MAG: deaminase, partial [Promethearchaeota archaeon]
AIHGTSIKGETTLYSTTFPCMSCLKLIINAGISRLVYIHGYNMENKVKKEMVNESKLEIVKLC